MRILGVLERRIEQLIEGLFSRWAGHRVQPFDVRRQLLREMDRGANGGSRKLVLPNIYDVLLHPDDFAPYREVRASVIKEFVDALHARAGELGGRFDGPLRIQIIDRDGVPPGEIRVEARIEAVETQPETRPRRASGGAPRLRVLSGAPGDEHQEFPLKQPATTIGRDPGHAVVLSHPSVSRTHARIELGPAGTTIVDLGSTNGTILNGRLLRKDRAPLREGDRVQIGALVLEYLDPPNRP
jgi:Protein of unknown function (DUF3662)/FHA domain